ncbi:hypothetical protein BYT27DRAFT_7188168 [Phlegmacium glaucopus]|nr:hypothetical protein BYT27DRAFT_7188168 [Phlegmacium glaucopus]
MDSEHEWPLRRLPTLVQLCQRAAVAHVDSIYSLGEHLSYPLVKPILERCTMDQLHRFESSSPHLQNSTPELWKDLCFRKYRLTAVERYSFDDVPQDPDSWKSRYFMLQDAEAKRLEEVGSKLRSQRMEAVERKKEREVKYTDRVPPPKRTRTGWNTTVQPKTLFQKTRSEASKLQKTIYNARVLPPMPTAKSYQVAPQSVGPSLLPALPSSSSSRVTVNTVIKRCPAPAPSILPTLKSVASEPRTALSPQSDATSPPSTTTRPKSISSPSPPAAASPPASEPAKSPVTNKTIIKKDPMATLFVPKRKAYSQRPL